MLTTACKDNKICLAGDGDTEYTGNSTEGGETEWIYKLQGTVGRTAALPYSVCAYVPTPTADAECPGMEKAQAVSPLAFHVSSSAERASEDVCTLGQFLTSHCFNLRLQVMLIKSS